MTPPARIGVNTIETTSIDVSIGKVSFFYLPLVFFRVAESSKNMCTNNNIPTRLFVVKKFAEVRLFAALTRTTSYHRECP